VDVRTSAGTKPLYQSTAGAVSKLPPPLLTNAQLALLVNAAKQLWTEVLGRQDSRLALLDSVQVSVGNLPDDRLGITIGNSIYLDSTAAGRGWFVDSTPLDNSEFTRRLRTGELLAMASSPAHDRIDALTVVMHELGHVLGFDDASGEGVMAEVLSDGVRRLDLNVGPVNSPTSRAPIAPLSCYLDLYSAHNLERMFDPSSSDWASALTIRAHGSVASRSFCLQALNGY
jgi:hypothetical protein